MNWTWFHKLGSPKWFYEISGRWLPWLAAAAVLLLGIGLVWGLAFAPPEKYQGDSYRIIYIHVPTAFMAQSCYLMMAVAGVVGLVWKMKLADVALQCAAPIGAWLCFVSLLTGAIWGKPTWGTFWVWDARLTSMLILLFLYFGIIALGQSISNRDSAAKACAVLSVVGAVNIPIIKYSVEWWNTLHQPATFSVTGKASMSAEMWVPLLISILGIYCFFATVLLLRMRLEVLKREARANWAKNEVLRLNGGGSLMYFDSFAALLAMGKHGAYVWSAYGLSLAVLAVNVALPILARRRYLQDEARRLRRESKS